MQSGHLPRGYIESMEKKVKDKMRLTPKLPVILTAASLAQHGVLVSITKELSLSKVDLGSVPTGQLGSLAACIEVPRGNVGSAHTLRIENVTNCDIIGLIDNVKWVRLVLYEKVTLSTEETKSIVRAMNSGRIKELFLGKKGVSLDINTMMVQYKGEGKCAVIKALDESARKYGNDIKKWAMQMGWVVKRDYDDEVEIVPI